MRQRSVIIIGGGPAGLTAAIHLGRNGVPVIIFEKEKYPHHKVCGEYLSKEIVPYLENLEVPLQSVEPKDIMRFQYSDTDGKLLETTLPLGGLGISRYAFDSLLNKFAEKNVVRKQEKVTSVKYCQDKFIVKTTKNSYTADFVLGAYGKRDILDKNLNRKFFKKPAPWIAIKSHFNQPDFPDDLVALHNFKGGYCGLSKTETGVVNVCYLATYKSFRNHKDPVAYRKNVLQKNFHLNNFFSTAIEVFEKPLSIAQIYFGKKIAVKDNILMIGDTAGLIHPLCGNGMAMAVKSAKIASELILKNYEVKELDRAGIGKEFEKRWNREFSNKLRTGKWIQKALLSQRFAGVSQAVLSKMPFLLPAIIKKTHGSTIV